MSGIENRQLPRTNVVWRAAYLIDAGKYAQLKIINVSEGGVAAISENRFKMDQQIQMVLEIPHPDGGGKWIHAPAKGVIVHTILSGDAYKIGVKFTEIDTNHKGLIKTWVAKLNSPIM